MKNIYIILVNIFILFNSLLAQKEHNHWTLKLFSSEKHSNCLSFNSQDGEPIFYVNKKIVTAFANISDSLGNIIFYGNGYNYYNNKFEQLYNIDTTRQDIYWTYRDIIFQIPERPNYYYYVTPDHDYYAEFHKDYLRYSIFDFSPSSQARILFQNIKVPIKNIGDLAVTYHSNKKDVWIVTKNRVNKIFSSLLATKDGIKLEKNSYIDVYFDRLDTLSNRINFTKLSAKGDIFVYYNRLRLTLMKFDKTNGIVSNPIQIDTTNLSLIESVEISPNSNYLYLTTHKVLNEGNSVNSIYQLDISEWNQSKIVNSIFQITSKHYNGDI